MDRLLIYVGDSKKHFTTDWLRWGRVMTGMVNCFDLSHEFAVKGNTGCRGSFSLDKYLSELGHTEFDVSVRHQGGKQMEYGQSIRRST